MRSIYNLVLMMKEKMLNIIFYVLGGVAFSITVLATFSNIPEIWWYNTFYNREEIIKLAKGGDSDAQVELGNWYSNGEKGFSQNYSKANYWYRKAVVQDNPYGMHNLALSYVRGQGVEKNYILARLYFSKACELGLKQSCDNVNKIDKNMN